MIKNITAKNLNKVTKEIGLDEHGQHPNEGWGIFDIDGRGEAFEVQKIDEINMLWTDDEAIKLAQKHGLIFKDKKNPYKITGFNLSN